MKKFSKKDLDYGMVVEKKNGNRCLYIYNNTFVALNGWAMLDSDTHYTDDLTAKVYCNKEADIVKVYKDYTCNELLWERTETPSLTATEQFILNNIIAEYKWIARDQDGDLYVYKSKPRKVPLVWAFANDSAGFEAFNHLFQFIKWEDEEPYLISDLLKGE